MYFCDSYFSQNILFKCITFNYQSFTFIVSARYLGTWPIHHFQQHSCLKSLRLYRESQVFERTGLLCKFWRYAVLTSSEIWSQTAISQSSSEKQRFFSFLIHSWIAYPLVVLGSLWDLWDTFLQGSGPVLCFWSPQSGPLE